MKKRGLYRRLALNGIRGNRQLYLPHILACIGMVMIYFIITSLSESDVIRLMSGGDSAQLLLKLGKGVIAIFAAIFLFYANSFLMKRRQKEFGLYNVLGMSKRNIARILIWESVLTAGTAIIGGIILGIILCKLAELVLVKLISGDVTFTIELAWQAIPETALLFAIIFLFLFVFSLLKVRLTNPIELLKSESMGEKPPKANRFFGLLGIVILGFGYYLALTLENPMTMMIGFLLAVVLVMIGTYLLFMSGSVLMCGIMQKSKRYYYKPNHFVSVSSMAYRMKRNGAGLAYYSSGLSGSDIDTDLIGSFNIKSEIEYPSFCPLQRTAYGMLVIIVDDLDIINPVIEAAEADGSGIFIYKTWWYGFDTNLSDAEQIEYYNYPDFSKKVYAEYIGENWDMSYDSLAENRSDYYGMFGGLLFLGIFLSLMFVLSAVLIIYYKQISEGYEDASRFEIMQKVGMTKADIKKSINSQMLSVFLLPVVMSAVHIAFASPIMIKMLRMCGFMNTWLFLGMAAAYLAVVVVVYTVVYKITSNAYYHIVS